MMTAYISYRLSDDKQAAPNCKKKLTKEEEYLKVADKLFGK